jgi:hypothetical protein
MRIRIRNIGIILPSTLNHPIFQYWVSTQHHPDFEHSIVKAFSMDVIKKLKGALHHPTFKIPELYRSTSTNVVLL